MSAPAPLWASLEKLKVSTAELNQIADDAADIVQATEKFLTQCGVGVDAFVQVSSEVIDDHGTEEITSLGYHRWAGKFRIVVYVGIDPDNSETKPWSEWSRDVKLETIKMLPALLEKIAANVDAYATAAKHATATVAEVLTALDRKGGK